jgi:hypothetical protein
MMEFWGHFTTSEHNSAMETLRNVVEYFEREVSVEYSMMEMCVDLQIWCLKFRHSMIPYRESYVCDV